MRMRFKVLLLTCMLTVLCCATAAASGPASSPLPGFPRFRGVMLVRDGSSASASRERAISAALKTASTTNPNCSAGAEPGADLCYWGGPIVRAHKVHLIFWEGTVVQGHSIGSAYKKAIERYFEDVAAASGANSNVYAVETQYGGSNGAGEYSVSFGGSLSDVYVDNDPLPVSGKAPGQCTDAATPNGICITDKDLQTEIEVARQAENLNGHHWESSLADIYFVFTPHEVGGCFFGEGESPEANACAFETYCAYHSSFVNASKEAAPPLYANLPDSANVPGCDAFEHPNEAEGVDATLDTASHEHNETITDPLASSWFDVIGQEVADKCLPPETFDIYGGAIEGSPATAGGGKIIPGTLYNQIVGSDHYYLQREWSNTAFNGEGGCVQRMLPTSFTPPAEAKATVPATFDGSSSGETGDPAIYWVWSFGDGMQVGTPEPTASHTYAVAKTYQVTLTAFDAYGNSSTHTLSVTVGAAPPPPPPPTPPPAPEPITLTKTVNVLVPVEPTAYTAAQLAQKLGLPANGATLSGLGAIALGHAECPPACTVGLRLFATARTTKHHRRTVRRVPIGTLTTTVAAKGAGGLALTLNETGRRLLGRSHRLFAQLVVTVTGREGGSWEIKRSLTLSSSGHVARHRQPRR
jgi:hypothetical protein